MPDHFIFAPTPDLNDKSRALNIGTKLMMKIRSAPGRRNTHPIRFCFLLSVIFFGLLKKTPPSLPLEKKRGTAYKNYSPVLLVAYIAFVHSPCSSAKSASRLRRITGIRLTTSAVRIRQIRFAASPDHGHSPYRFMPYQPPESKLSSSAPSKSARLIAYCMLKLMVCSAVCSSDSRSAPLI